MPINFKFLIIACVALSACTTPSDRLEIQPISLEETSSAVKEFSKRCLANLPEFEGFQAQARKDGLVASKKMGMTAYHDPDKLRVVAINEELEGIKVCGIGFVGDVNIPAVSQKFLNEARRRTGGGTPREMFEGKTRLQGSVREAYALRNNSIFAHAIRLRGQLILHIFFVTEPVPDPFALDL